MNLGPGGPPPDEGGDGLLGLGLVTPPSDAASSGHGFLPTASQDLDATEIMEMDSKEEKKRRKHALKREEKRQQKVKEQEEKTAELKAETEKQLTESESKIEVEPVKDMETEKEENTGTRDRSRSPPPMDQVRQSYESARKLDGLPPRQQPVSEQQLLRGNQWTEEMDDELLAEEFNEKLLSPEEKKMFDEAKDKALMVWIENAAWKAVDAKEAAEGEVVPARFLQRWKKTSEGQKANARVIIQGFKHKDVLEQQLETESPTLSRVGRMLIYTMTVHMRWKLFSADVKSAFMQADSIDEVTRIFVKPTSDMRRRLERLMGLKPHQILKATKPAFGDVRAPRQWYQTADGVMIGNLKFYRHALDRCVFLSAREATIDDPEYQVFEDGGVKMVVDGVLGLHVDDYIGAGEGVMSLQDLEGEYDGSFRCFRDRLCGLSHRFRFGSWSFGSHMDFCGAEVEQSLDFLDGGIREEDQAVDH